MYVCVFVCVLVCYLAAKLNLRKLSDLFPSRPSNQEKQQAKVDIKQQQITDMGTSKAVDERITSERTATSSEFSFPRCLIS